MLINRLTIIAVLFSGVVYAKDIETKGDCSPAIIENESSVSINCYINDLPLDSIVRQGKANELVAALKSGISAKTIFQGFVLGNKKYLSGVDFFKNVKSNDLTRFLIELSQHININDRIYLKDDAYTTLFWLAAESQRKEIIFIMAKSGMAIHVDRHIHGGYYDTYITPEFFPIINLIREGVLSVEDKEVLEELFANSFIFPKFNVKKEKSTVLPVSKSDYGRFFNTIDLREKIIAQLPAVNSRKPFDMANIPKLCRRASIADNFDWCERLKSVSLFYLSDDKSGAHWPYSVQLIGLMDIRSDYAIFFMHHTRSWGNIGFFYVPKKGTKYKMRLWNTPGSNSTPCWSDKLKGYDTACWRIYSYEQDFFDKSKFVGLRGFPVYTAGKKKISW